MFKKIRVDKEMPQGTMRALMSAVDALRKRVEVQIKEYIHFKC